MKNSCCFLPLVLVLVLCEERPLFEHELTPKPDVEAVVGAASRTLWSHKLAAAAQNVECSQPTDWVTRKVLEMGISTYNKLQEKRIFDMPWAYKYAVDKSESGEFLGMDGRHTEELKQRHESSKVFWERSDFDNSLNTEDVLLLGMHGPDLSDRAKLIPTLDVMFKDLTPRDLQDMADEVQELIESIPGKYDNPLLTFNALAVEGIYIRSYGKVYPDVVVIGDGVLTFLDDSGFVSDGPDFIYAHEYGHHMQYQTDILSQSSSDAKESRRAELMADPFGTYFLSHDTGGNMDKDQIMQLHQTAFSTGDCQVDADDHHGTPIATRMCRDMGCLPWCCRRRCDGPPSDGVP